MRFKFQEEMFTPFVRLLLLAFCTLASIAAAYYNIWSLLLFSSVASFLILFGYYRFSTIQLALKAVLVGDYKKADEMLAYIKHPDRLTKKNKLIYMFCQGMAAREHEDYNAAITALDDVILERIKPDQYLAMAILAITDIYMVKGQKVKAKQYFYKLKNLKIDKELNEAVRKMQHWIEN